MSLTRRDFATMIAGGGALTVGWPSAAAQPLAPATAEFVAQVEEPETQVDTGGNPFRELTAPVSINGQGPFPFLIDTGANVSCVSRKLADALALGPARPHRVHTIVGVQTRPAVMIGHLQVGDRNRRDVRAPALPIKPPEIGGVLGVDWLKGQRLVLNIKQRKLEITRSSTDRTARGRVVVPARLRWGQLTIVDADLGGRPINALIDSGSQVTLCNTALRQLRAEVESNPKQDPGRVQLETITGEPFSGQQIYLPFLRLGGLTLGNVPVVHAETHVFDVWGVKDKPALVLGMDILSEFELVALDFGRSTVRFDL